MELAIEDFDGDTLLGCSISRSDSESEFYADKDYQLEKMGWVKDKYRVWSRDLYWCGRKGTEVLFSLDYDVMGFFKDLVGYVRK